MNNQPKLIFVGSVLEMAQKSEHCGNYLIMTDGYTEGRTVNCSLTVLGVCHGYKQNAKCFKKILFLYSNVSFKVDNKSNAFF